MQVFQGWALATEFAGKDFWGTHRARDWDLFLRPFPESSQVLAPANSGSWPPDSAGGDLELNGLTRDGLLEAEWDSEFYPPDMAPSEGDEVIAAGRWVFDCGHEGKAIPGAPGDKILGYRAEVHPPAILVVAHLQHTDSHCIEVEFKVFAASRGGPVSAVPILIIQKFWGSYINPLGGSHIVFCLRSPFTGWRLRHWTQRSGYNTKGHRRILPATVEESAGRDTLQVTLNLGGFTPEKRLEISSILDVEWEH